MNKKNKHPYVKYSKFCLCCGKTLTESNTSASDPEVCFDCKEEQTKQEASIEFMNSRSYCSSAE